jgi:release factor glutamine methyltransferase
MGGPWTVLGMILWSADYLRDKGIDTGRLDAEHLLASAVGVDRLGLYLAFERPLTPAELDGYRPLLKRRAAREPLQYILGRQPFRELDLEVGPSVLIPRPETEVLVDQILEAMRGDDAGGTALDLGTGSGAIARCGPTEPRCGRARRTGRAAARLAVRAAEEVGALRRHRIQPALRWRDG